MNQMSNNWVKNIDSNIKIVVEAKDYSLENDKRLFIPFVQGRKWGVMNRDGEVIVQPKYNYVYGNYYSESPLFIVELIYPYAIERKTSGPVAYSRYKVGIVDASGDVVFDTNYLRIMPSDDGRLFSVENLDGLYGVLNREGEIIIPFGRYTFIDGFENGMARVKLGKVTNGVINSGNLWGIINEKGDEVLHLVYDNIWRFYGKNLRYTNVEKGGVKTRVYFHKLNPSLSADHPNPSLSDDNCDYDNTRHYDEFAGSYAQDVMDYSDEDIYDAFDGDPDAYWNID